MKVKIVFFDCDGILLFGNPWRKIANAVGLPAELDLKWFRDYYDNKLSFKRWNKNIEDYYKKGGLNRKMYEEILDFKNYTINKEGKELVEYIKSQGIEIAIISSGTGDYVSKVADYFGIKYWRANITMVFDQNDMFLKFQCVDEDPKAKVIEIKSLCKMLNISPSDSLFIGDADNDMDAFEFTKRGILYKTNDPRLEKLAFKKINNLLEIIDIIKDINGQK